MTTRSPRSASRRSTALGEVRCSQDGLRVGVGHDPSRVDVSSSTLPFLAEQLRALRHAIGSRWRRLSAGRQSLLALAHLRMGHTYSQLAPVVGVGITTAYRYVAEAVDPLAAFAPT